MNLAKEILLIEQVQEREQLWKPEHVDYKNPWTRKNLWLEISKLLKTSSKQLEF